MFCACVCGSDCIFVQVSDLIMTNSLDAPLMDQVTAMQQHNSLRRVSKPSEDMVKRDILLARNILSVWVKCHVFTNLSFI